MKNNIRILAALFLIVPLTACVNRDQADAKLTRGCAAAVEAFLADGFKIKSIKQSTYGYSETFGKNYRTVKMDYVETDDWADVDKTASCIFAEEFTFMNMGHKANIYQVKFDDKIFGKDGDEIHGTYEENLKLTEKVDNALNGI
jgi:hypothetical protein